MSLVTWIAARLPGILLVLAIGGVIGVIADTAYSWLFDDDSWTTNAVIVTGIALSIILSFLIYLAHRSTIVPVKADH